MAKIIGYEKNYKKQYKATCKNCGAIVVFDENELRDSYQYNEYCFSSGKCPSCGSSVSLDKKHSKYSEVCTNQHYIDEWVK